MKNTKKIFFIIVLVILFIAIFFFWFKSNKQKNTLKVLDSKNESIVLESLKFEDEKIIIYEGTEIQLDLVKKPTDIEDEILWESSNDKIAIVDKFGKVTTKKAGVTKITAKNEEGSVSTEMIIKVKAITKEQSLELSEKELNLNVGDTALIEYAILPSDATYKNIRWQSKNENIAKVEEGLITAYSKGNTVITAETKHGVKATINVNVNAIELEELKFSTERITIKKGEKLTLTPVIIPANATVNDFFWKSDNDGVVSVDKHGKITGKELGTAKITIISVDGKLESNCEIVVSEDKINPTEIKIENEEIEIKEEDSINLSVSFTPDNTTNKVVTWSSADKDIAMVSQDGIVTGIKKGTTTITAKSLDGNIETTKKVTVLEKIIEPTNITINQKSFSLSVGESMYIDATITPSIAVDKTIEWSSTNMTVAEVENGKITAIKPGLTEIIAKTHNGIQDKITVEVNNHFEITYLNGLLAEEITESDVQNMKSLGITLVPLESNSTDITEYRHYMFEALTLLNEYDIDVIATDYQLKLIMEEYTESPYCNIENKTFCHDYKDTEIKALLTEMVDFYNNKEITYNEVTKSYPYENLVGWNIKNKPSTKEFDRISKVVNFLNNYDFTYDTYINLHANYESNIELYGSHLALKTYYEDYVNQFIKKIKTKVLSTNYNLTISEDERSSKKDYYNNLSTIKSISKNNNVIPMNITNITKTSTINEIAWQSSINLAFKMKRISYNNYKNVIIDNNKNATLTYYNIMKINTWLYALGNELYDKELVSTYSFNDDSLTLYNTSNIFGNITSANSGLISIFDNNSFLLVNSEFKLSNVFTFENSLLDMKWFNTDTRRWEDINGDISTDYYTINTSNNTIEVSAGYCVLLSKK